MPPRVANGERDFGPRRLRRQAKLAGVEGWSQTPPPLTMDPGEWEHGWQYYASSASEHHFRETVVLARSCPGDQVHLRSHSGTGSGAVLHGSPTGPEFQVQPLQFRTLVLERFRLPLILTETRCECGGQNDIFGRHRAACPQSGRLKRRAVPTENFGPSVPRGRRDSHPQCQIAGHERASPGN